MVKKKIVVVFMIGCISVLAGCGSQTEKDSEEIIENFIQEVTTAVEEQDAEVYPDNEITESEEARQDEADAESNDSSASINENEEKDVYTAQEELPDGIYLIKGDTFERFSSDNLEIKGDAYDKIEYEEGEWPTVHPGDQLAFKGDYSLTQDIRLHCSMHDYYTFPCTVEIGGNFDCLHVHTVFDDQLKLDVDTITVDGQSIPVGMYLGSGDKYGWYLEGLDWRIGEASSIGKYLDGNFEKGFQVAMSGFQGTEYKEIEMAATCHVIEMRGGELGIQENERDLAFEATREGYFILTIPDDMSAGYGTITSFGQSEFLQLYIHIQ